MSVSGGSNVGKAMSFPTVGNGIVFVGKDWAGMVRGLNASTGNELWNSGSTITGGTYAALSVCGGGSFVSSLEWPEL